MSVVKDVGVKALVEVGKAVGREVGDQVNEKYIAKPVGGLLEILGSSVASGHKGLRRSIYDTLIKETKTAKEGTRQYDKTFKDQRRKGDWKKSLVEKPVTDPDTGIASGDFKRTSKNPLMSWVFNNPAPLADIGAIGIPLAGAGLATYFATKPKSDYALGLGASTGNSNIDAARASAYYQQQTAQMKFDHQMQLQNARQQAQTPGRQSYGNALGLGLPDQLGGSPRDAYNMAASIVGAQSPIYK